MDFIMLLNAFATDLRPQRMAIRRIHFSETQWKPRNKMSRMLIGWYCENAMGWILECDFWTEPFLLAMQLSSNKSEANARVSRW